MFSGMITSFDTLVLRDKKYYSEMDINILNETTVDKIDLDTNEIFFGNEKLKYDTLVIATGAKL